MRPLPTPPAPGKPVSATLIRQLIDAIRERTILPGRNTSVKRGKNGTVVNAAAAAVTTAVPAADPLHPWKVFGLIQTGGIGERNLFKIYTPGGPSLRCKVFIGSDLVNVDGLTLRQVQGENNDYCYFEDEEDLEDGEHTLYIVIYLTEASGSDSSGEEGVVDFELAAKMVVDPEAFKEEDYVHTVYAIVPVATIRIAHEGEDVETGEPSGHRFCKVESQRLLGDVVYEAEYYL